jgi:hypothetical protein
LLNFYICRVVSIITSVNLAVVSVDLEGVSLRIESTTPATPSTINIVQFCFCFYFVVFFIEFKFEFIILSEAAK